MGDKRMSVTSIISIMIYLGPRVPLSLVLEVSSTGFQQRLIDTTATGDDSDHSAIGGRNGFLRARRQFDFGS